MLMIWGPRKSPLTACRPIIGGLLANPYEQFPNTLGRFEFWRTYPYALPCFVMAFYCITSFFLALFCLNEVQFQPRDFV
jgi:hypothetical protein